MAEQHNFGEQSVSKEYKKAASQMVQEGNSKAKKLVAKIGEQGPELTNMQ